MCLSPLSEERVASFPHVFESSCKPPVPSPILESQVEQSFCWFPMIPILAFDWLLVPTTLNPSLLQLVCSEAWGPARYFHLLRPSGNLRYIPSAISEYNELALRWILLLSCSSFQGKSLRSASPNKRAIWFLVCQNQSSPLQGCKLPCRSRKERNSGRCSVNDTQVLKALFGKIISL